MMVPTSPQNSIRVCQSRPLRASRDASIANTAPTRPSQMAAKQPLEPWSVDATSGPAEIIVDDFDRGPPKLPGAIGERVLTAAALRIVQDLIARRLANIDEGAAAQVISRDLGHRPPSRPGQLRSPVAVLRPALPEAPSATRSLPRAARPGRTTPAGCLRS